MLKKMNKLNLKILLFINIIVNGIKDKKMRGNVIERKLVETPKKNPESIIKKNKLLGSDIYILISIHLRE